MELSNIINPIYLQAILETFSEDTGLASAILNENAHPLTFELNHCKYCKKIRNSKAGLRACRKSDKEAIKKINDEFKKSQNTIPIFYRCSNGLIDFCAPLVIDNAIIAYLLGGQFRYNGNKELCIGKFISGDMDYINISDDINELYHETKIIDETKVEEIKNKVYDLVILLNNVLDKIGKWKTEKEHMDFMKRISYAQNIDDLLELMINFLPKLMGAKDCSILLVEKDEKDEEHLVLRKTTFRDLKQEENSGFYKRGEGLTGWVWENSQSLRLNDVNDNSELSEYKNLYWQHKLNDSNEHKGFLCVPIIGVNNEVLGVIRIPHKIRYDNTDEEIGFTQHDEIYLQFIASYVSWALEFHLQKNISKAIINQGLINAVIILSNEKSSKKIFDLIVECLIILFGFENKKFFVNTLDNNKQYWRIRKIAGDLDLKDFKQKFINERFHITRGLTGKVIRERKSILSSNPIELLEKDEYIPVVDGGLSVMSVPLMFSDKVYGAISIASNKKFEFSKDVELKLLETFVLIVSSTLFRLNARKISKLFYNLLYNITKLIKKINKITN
jgi:ligand-binding sensor protein/GAF domain-containing protein